MKKSIILMGLVFATTTAFTQTSVQTSVSSEISKTEKEVTFSSQNQKEANIEMMEKLIARKESESKTKVEMARYYAHLEKVKKATITTK
jgi:ABC-type glycerol-3-phosphate transport system substrate-binding protein